MTLLAVASAANKHLAASIESTLSDLHFELGKATPKGREKVRQLVLERLSRLQGDNNSLMLVAAQLRNDRVARELRQRRRRQRR